jgi:hypothetical protein
MDTDEFNHEDPAADDLPKNVLSVLTHDDVAAALKGKKRCPRCGCAFVYRTVTLKGTQSFNYNGVLEYKEYEFQRLGAILRCDGCDAIVGRSK